MLIATTTITHPSHPVLTLVDFKEKLAAGGEWSKLSDYWNGFYAATGGTYAISENGDHLAFTNSVTDEHAQALRDAYADPLVVQTVAAMEALGFVVKRSFKNTSRRRAQT